MCFSEFGFNERIFVRAHDKDIDACGATTSGMLNSEATILRPCPLRLRYVQRSG